MSELPAAAGAVAGTGDSFQVSSSIAASMRPANPDANTKVVTAAPATTGVETSPVLAR